jgi:hypothetical protein
MNKLSLLLFLCLVSLRSLAGFYPNSVTTPDDGSGTTPTVCSGDPNGSYVVTVNMCPTTTPFGSPTITVKWFFNDPTSISPVFSQTTIFSSTASTVFTLPPNQFNWPAPGVYPGMSGLRVELSWGPPTIGPGGGCPNSPVVGVGLLVTVAAAAPPITGFPYICVGATHTLSSTAPGGVWLTSTPGVATAAVATATDGAITGVTSGTATITYTGGSCIIPATTIVTVSTTPRPILPLKDSVCTGECVVLSDSMSGGTWSSSCCGTIDPAGNLCGFTTGVTTVTYQVTPSCRTTRVVTVNQTPTPITTAPSATFCSGTTITAGSTPPGGTWSSGNTLIGTVGSTTGIVYGVSGGPVPITYTRLSCKAYTVVTVIQSPSAITGPSFVCQGGSITLSNFVSGGAWNSGSPLVASVAPFGPTPDGVVSGLALGTAAISYTISICAPAVKVVTVTTPPGPIGGNVPVCVNSQITLTDGVVGGSWSTSAPPTRITINSSTGVVTGVSAGTARVTYSIGTNCDVTAIVTVNPLPATIAGPNTVCSTFVVTLSDVDGPGTWAASNGNITIGATSGIVTGVTVGTSIVTYTLGTGCRITHTMTVNPLPSAITGPTTVCEGQVITLANVGVGTWASGAPGIASVVNPANPYITGAGPGTAPITFTLGTGCYTVRSVTVNPLPAQFAVTGGGAYCTGGSGMPIGLANSASGVSYQLYRVPGIVVGIPMAGTTGTPIPFGTFTAAGTYTVTATNGTTGCTNSMLGSAVISINPYVTPSVTMTNPSSSDTMCGGLPVTFTAVPVNGGSAPAYQWTVNGSPVGTSAPNYTYTPANGDIIAVTLTTSEPCNTTPTAVATHTLTVLPSGLPSVSTAVMPNDTVCAGTAVTFSAIPVNGGSTPTFRWTKNGTNVATGPTYTFIPSNGDVVYCMMRSSATCNLVDSAFSGLTTLTVVTPGAPPSVVISATPGTTIAPGTSDTLVATAFGAGTSPAYQWYINGVLIPGATSSTFVSSTFANHDSVTCKVTSSNLCKETGFKSVIITVKSGNGGVSVNGLVIGNGVHVMPNPNNGLFAIKGEWSKGDEEVSIEITDMVGKVIYTGTTLAEAGQVNTQISLPSIASGTYMLNLRSESGSKVFRIVKE